MSSLYQTNKTASNLIKQMFSTQNMQLISLIDKIIIPFPLRNMDALPSLFEKLLYIDDYKRWLQSQPKKVRDFLKTSTSKKTLMSIRSIAFDICSASASLESKLLGKSKKPPKKRMRRSLDEDFSTDAYRAGSPEEPESPEITQPSESPLLNIIKLFQERLNEHRCPLYRAIKYNNLKDVQSLIQQERYQTKNFFQAYSQENYGYTIENRFVLLHRQSFQADTAINVAARYDRDEIVKILVSAGDNINDAPKNQNPLMIAIQNNNLELVRTIMSMGADPRVSLLDDSILGHTARSQTPEAMELLLSSPLIDPMLTLNNENNYGQNLLNLAIQYRNKHDMVRYLIVNKGCDPLKPNIFGRSALDYATTYGKRFGHMKNLQTIEQILSGADRSPYQLRTKPEEFRAQVSTLSISLSHIQLEQAEQLDDASSMDRS